MTEWPRDPDPYHFAAMLDDTLRAVELGQATPKMIRRARQTYADGVAAIERGSYAGYTWPEDEVPA